jgi:hypothetical protein
MNIEIVLTPTTGPIDEPLHGFVCGLPPGESVTVRAQLRDSRDLLWRSHVTLSAGRDGLATMDVDELIASLTLAGRPCAVRSTPPAHCRSSWNLGRSMPAAAWPPPKPDGSLSPTTF